MQVTTLLVSSLLATSACGFSIPKLYPRQTTATVSSDEGTANVEVPATTDAGSDVGGKADAASAIAGVVQDVYQYVQGLINDDIERRKAFTQNVAARGRAATGLNIVVSNVGYTFDGTATSVTNTDYNAKVGSDVTFDVVTFEKGTFTLNGDGGFQNWAYIVSSGCTANGKTLTC